ncbi:MAG: Rpn family recombination-promoting nuclease/putative transposase [Myxococcaceae bacterium]
MGRHDHAFHSLMAERGAARALLEAVLPRALLKRVVDGPHRLPTHFIDESLRESVADQVLRWRLDTGESAFAYIIVEHKRRQRRFDLVQLLRYQALLAANLSRQLEPTQGFPTIITVVVFNGAERWSGPRRFQDLTQPPRELRRFAIDFEPLLLDLGALDVESLTRHRKLRGGLLALKTATVRGDEQLALVTRAIRQLKEDPSTLRTFLSYLGQVVGAEALPLVEQAAAESHEEKTMRTINQYLIELGRRKGDRAGFKRGVEKGRASGEAAALRGAITRVLTLRFKRVPDTVRSLLDGADTPTLERWFDDAMSAPSLTSFARPAKRNGAAPTKGTAPRR